MDRRTLYVFKREGDRSIFMPSGIFSGMMVWMFTGGALLMLYLSSIFLRHLNGASAKLWIAAIFIAVAGYSAALALRSWSASRTPLSQCHDRGQHQLWQTATVRRRIGSCGPDRPGAPWRSRRM